MSISHDFLFKDVGIAFPDDLITLTLPNLAKQIDLSAVKMVPGRERFNALTPKRRWYPDLVADVWGRSNAKRRAMAHLEVEYDFRRRKVPRLRDYNHVLALETGLQVHTGVIYLHGGEPNLQPQEHRDVSFGCHLRSFHYNSLGLARASALDYLERPEPLAWALAIWMNPKGIGNRAELAIACLRRIAGAELDDGRRFKLLNFVQTYVTLDKTASPEYEVILRETENQEVQEMMMTWADQVKAEAHQEGVEEGRQEGVEEGIEKGIEEGIEKMRDVVMDLASQRFGQLSEGTRHRIAETTSLEQLAEMAKNVLKVNSLEELRVG